MNFLKLVETRFADPVTALDLSKKFVCYGSAMGRIAFYSIEHDKDIALSDSQPELIRGITHSQAGDNIFVSIGDISCQRLNADDLSILDYVQIVENIDERQHKANCERAYTLAYKHFNCVLTIAMGSKEKKDAPANSDLPPIMMSNLESNILENYGEGEVEFTQNCVPFDFDGDRLLWMQYLSADEREVFLYNFDQKAKITILKFHKRDGLISHVRMLDNSLFYVKNTNTVIRYDMDKKTTHVIGRTRDAVLAFFVSSNLPRDCDHDGEEEKQEIALEINEEGGRKLSGVYVVACLDESENVYLFGNKSEEDMGRGGLQVKIKECRDFAEDIQDKDLFGMGYPYFIVYYQGMITFATDFGICLLKVQNMASF